MAVPEQTPYIEHTGNGITTSFALGFQCETKDHLIVLVDDIEPPIATWSLTGGNVVFTTAPAAGKKITLQRNTPFSRNTDYQSYNNSFRPPAVNKDFDWIWLKLQELGVADWILGTRIDALKNYVDRKDDELKAYLMEEIRKQGVALDQLDEYYNYLMQRLAQIAVDKGWDASFVSYSGLNQKQINDGLESVDNLMLITDPLDNMRVLVKSYNSDFGKGGGNFIFKKGDQTVPDNVYSFAGIDGVWYRHNWKSPNIYDAGIRADGTDETVKFKALLKAVSAYFGSSSISLRGKNVKVTDFEMPSNITIYGGKLDFSESQILADNSYYNGFIIGANRSDRITNPSYQTTYAALPKLEKIGFVKVGFKVPPAGTYNFSTDLMYFHKLDGFVLKHCYGEDFNSNRIVTITGGVGGTVTSNDIPMFALVDPINGRCSDIKIKYNKFNAGHLFSLNANGQRLIVPSMRLTGCEDIEIAKNNFKNFNIPILVDAYCKDAEAYNNTCSIDDEVLDVWLSTTSRTDQVGLYGGQSAYNIKFYNNNLRNFINKAAMLEGVSHADVYSNTLTYSDYAKTLITSTALFYGIQLNANIRQHPYTSVAGLQHVNVYDNRMLDAKAPFIMSSTTPYSMKNIRVNDNTFESIGSQMAMTVNRCFDSVFTNNKCKGGLSIGEVKDISFSLNSHLTPSNYALYFTSSDKTNLRFIDNDFVAESGPAIYNGTSSGTVIELHGGKIQAKDGVSAAMQKASGAGAVRAYGFDNGIATKKTVISQSVSLGAGARAVFEVAYPGIKTGWSVRPQLQGMGTQWTVNSIDLGLKAVAKNNTIDLLIRNEGAASVTSTFNILLEVESYLDNTSVN